MESKRYLIVNCIVIGSVFLVLLLVVFLLLQTIWWRQGRVGSPGRLGLRGISGHVICPQKAASSLLQRPSQCSSAPFLFFILVLLLLLLVLLWSRDLSTESCL